VYTDIREREKIRLLRGKWEKGKMGKGKNTDCVGIQGKCHKSYPGVLL